MPMPDQSCANCRFFTREDDPDPPGLDEGLCRIRPPTISRSPDWTDDSGEWPRINGYDWCGQWAGIVKRGRMVASLGLTVRSDNVLASAGITTLEQLCTVSENQLLAIPSMGRAGVREIVAALDALGLSLMK
jgi:hypothetical protein